MFKALWSLVSGLWSLALLGTVARAQQLPDRGAMYLRRGTDTIVSDRFIRNGDTLVGSAQVKGQQRVDYVAILSPVEIVRSLSISVFAPGATATSEPVQKLRVSLQGDSATVETSTGVHQRVGTQSGAIPMFNNALALTEIFTRRAHMTGNVADIPYFALSGGATITLSIRPHGTDSITMKIASQEYTLKLDPTGRIAGGVIVGTPLEFLRAGPEAAAGLKVAMPASITPPADYSAPAGAPYTAEEVRITGPGGITLGGTLTKPTNVRGLFPAVVMITGSGQQDRDETIPFAGGIKMFRQIADTLSRRGIAVLRLDDRGIGASGGDPTMSTSADFADDIRAGLAYLRTRTDIDPKRLALVGHSEGGMIAPVIAATDHQLKALVVLAGPGEAPIEISMAQNKYIVDHDTTLTPAKRDSVLRAARASLAPARQTVPWLKYWMGFDPVPVMRNVQASTLILQGATDRQVPVDQAEKLAKLIRAGGNTDVTVHVFPAKNHLFIDDPDGNFNNYDKLKTNKVGPDVLGALAGWLVVKLGVPAQ